MQMDLYPAKATKNGAVTRNLRVRVNPGGTIIWQMDRSTLVVSEFLRTESPPTRVGASQRWQVGEVTFEPQRGCGCNHPMYTWVPPDGD